MSLDNSFERENGKALQKLVYDVAFKKPKNETPEIIKNTAFFSGTPVNCFWSFANIFSKQGKSMIDFFSLINLFLSYEYT